MVGLISIFIRIYFFFNCPYTLSLSFFFFLRCSIMHRVDLLKFCRKRGRIKKKNKNKTEKFKNLSRKKISRNEKYGIYEQDSVEINLRIIMTYLQDNGLKSTRQIVAWKTQPPRKKIYFQFSIENYRYSFSQQHILVKKKN